MKRPSVNDELNLRAQLEANGREMEKLARNLPLTRRKPPIKQYNKGLGRAKATVPEGHDDVHVWRSHLLSQWPRGIAPEDAPPQLPGATL